MSTSELAPLFPTPTHPALPIAAQLLATLRTLTAPGKGNDLKSEERAALVGVAALLGCERTQSADLTAQTAQKASSVSPAHFRSALAHCRRILASVPTSQPPASSTSSSRRSPRSTSIPAAAADDQPSPFQTPKKKFKYSSGVDISGLVRSGSSARRHEHSPAQSSPLKLSVTPASSSRLKAAAVEGDGDEDEEMGTPTKRTKFGVKEGVDLERVELDPESRGKRKRQDVSAFFALRPGGGGGGGGGQVAREGEKEDVEMDGWEVENDLGAKRRRERRARRVVEGEDGDAKKRRRRERREKRRDWTYSETSGWGGEEHDTGSLDQVWTKLEAWLGEHGRALPTEVRGTTGEEVMLSFVSSAVRERE